ncbi:MAG TPA: methyltransferase domain-containing protein [Vicinamibacterales bacterium]|nr:methyltransferase domain-containing protein [Vicinamibacterales bacterium]
MIDDRFATWLAALELRHFADLQFAEVTRALRALSSTYVERRGRLAERGAFDSAGKRAAYALYYSPLHYLTVQHIAEALEVPPVTHLLDVGCGAGAAGAAWAARGSRSPLVTGLDAHPWALTEAAFTYRSFNLTADLRRGHAARLTIPRSVNGVVAGWVLNELDAAARLTLLDTLRTVAAAGGRVLIIEPISTRVSPWWDAWVRGFEGTRSRADEWRFRVELPDLLQRLDHAAGMRHDQLKARSLYLY